MMMGGFCGWDDPLAHARMFVLWADGLWMSIDWVLILMDQT